MKDRFTTLFSQDSDSMPRVWTGNEDKRAITNLARSASLKLLSVLDAIRFDEEANNVEKTLVVTLVDKKKVVLLPIGASHLMTPWPLALGKRSHYKNIDHSSPVQIFVEAI